MGDPLPPDPYLALGVAKDAPAASIKAVYRKLVLKCHPDKVQDVTKKQEASDNFHLIQTAYEIIGDEDRRARYDAQCKLAELRKDVMERGGGGARGSAEIRTAAYKMPTESARGGGEFYARGPDRYTRVSPTYEERRPSYAPEDYFDPQPRSATRKYDDYERSAKHSSPRDEREKVKAATKAKENERSSRKKETKRTDRDIHRDRERKSEPKTAYVEVQTASDSDSDERERRRAREDPELHRAREAYYEDSRKQREEAQKGYYADDRARKMFLDAKDYIERSTVRPAPRRAETETVERRLSPGRNYSSKSKVEVLKQEGRPSLQFRRGSGTIKPNKSSGRDGKTSSREKVPTIVDEPHVASRPTPTLNHTKSSPADIHIRPPLPRQRSHSMEEEHTDQPPIPQMRRSETMPMSPSSHPAQREARRKDRSRTEDAYASPDLTPEPEPRKYRYHTEYADDVEYPTPDGYRTEVREPSSEKRGITRSPSPVKEERNAGRQRSASSKHATAAPRPAPPPLPRTTSTSYVYPSSKREDPYYRPTGSRDNSDRDRLYGEVPTTRSPNPAYMYSPPPENVRVQKEYKQEDFKVQTGYNRRTPSHVNDRPSYNRSGSSRQPIYA